MSDDEIMDIVDDNDVVIRRETRERIYSQGLINYRVVNAFIENSSGSLWIPRRSPNKRIFPLCLDMSMGGHVISNESYEEAFERELKEELNISLAQVAYIDLGRLSPYKDNVSSFMKVYKIITDATPSYNKNDFIAYYWLKPEEVLRKIEFGDRSKSDLPKLIRKFWA